MSKIVCVASLALILVSCASSADPDERLGSSLPPVSSDRLAAFEATFLIHDLETGERIVHGAEGLDRRSSPCSTFKIPHALIALEEGVLAEGAATVLSWNGRAMPIKSWERDHDLQSAITHSVVWYFQELARRIGLEKEKSWLQRLEFGNEDPSSDLERFWLGGGSLKISPLEQARFWERLLRHQHDARSAKVDTVLRLAELDRGPAGARLLGKTGSAVLGDELDADGLGWFVGAVERPEGARVFVLRIEGPGAWGPEARRLTLQILKDLELWP